MNRARCDCGDMSKHGEVTINSMCCDCFNVGCQPGGECRWGGDVHREVVVPWPTRLSMN